MNIDTYRSVTIGQFEAALGMMKICLERCPEELWDTHIAQMPFWLVAYHTLCFVDCYLAPSDEAWQPRQTEGNGIGPGGLHPKGRAELEDEFPSRRFERGELLAYVEICRTRLHEAMAAETAESLAGPSGFAWVKTSRAELHLYNLRHAAHHVGALSAFLHRHNVGVSWVFSGFTR